MFFPSHSTETALLSFSELINNPSSRFFVEWWTDRRNRKIANQGKEVIVTVTVADSFSDLDLVVEALELAGADWVDGMGS